MKIRLTLLTGLIILLPVTGSSQDLNQRTLITIENRETEAGEFITMFRKSGEPGKPLAVEEYFQQFTEFKLKVADAIHNGFDTTESFRNELQGYRNQLAQSYLTDTVTREKLLRKAYERSLTEINAWHILVAMAQNPSPDDTLKTWKKAAEIRTRIINGEPFEQVARATSDDPSVKTNGGNLGYFTVFQMIMPFEDAAYSMRTGVLSLPVRSPYGYHIIKVSDKRPSRGRVLVAHIMKNSPPGSGEEISKKAEEEINRIYILLQKGSSFSELARNFSDHKESAQKGGQLNWFGTGEMISDFSEAAFSIKDTGDYTKPVRTTYGWHIIKLLDRKPPGSYEESLAYLESRLNHSYLNSISRKAFVEKLKKEYHLRTDKEALNWFIANTDSLVWSGKKRYDRHRIPAGNICTWADQALKNSEFADYIEKYRSSFPVNESSAFVNYMLDRSLSENLIKYEDSLLEKKYPEFRYLMNEFHDGILLFEISEKKVWNRIPEKNDNDSLNTQSQVTDDKFLSAFQEKIEREWIEQLKRQYSVKIDSFVLNEVKRALAND